MQVALLNGGAKTSKTTMCAGIETYVQNELGLFVVSGDAGSHYRRITKMVLGKLGICEVGFVPLESEISDAVELVVNEHMADDPDADWSGLDSPLINDWVSTRVANRKIVKDDATAWYERTAEGALTRGADLLLINGRQPREVLAPWLGRRAIVPAIEFWAVCDPEVAAKRTLLARNERRTSRKVGLERKRIEARREADMHHDEYPVIPPEYPVQYVHYPKAVELMADLAVQESWETNGRYGLDKTQLPRQIAFDNSYMSKPKMNTAAGLLVVSALRFNR